MAATSDSGERRRSDDCVAWRDMVEYVADQEAKWHSVRAESLVFIATALEKLEKSLEADREALDDHQVWHRDVLENAITFLKTTQQEREQTGAQYRLGVIAIYIAIVSLILTSVIQIWLTHR